MTATTLYRELERRTGRVLKSVTLVEGQYVTFHGRLYQIIELIGSEEMVLENCETLTISTFDLVSAMRGGMEVINPK